MQLGNFQRMAFIFIGFQSVKTDFRLHRFLKLAEKALRLNRFPLKQMLTNMINRDFTWQVPFVRPLRCFFEIKFIINWELVVH